MKHIIILILMIIGTQSLASELPPEVSKFISDRDLCDHFRGEDFEGSSERAIFVRDSLDIYCSGTDSRLAALKRRFNKQKNIMELLEKYEENIES